MKNILLWLGVAFVVAGTAIGQLTGIEAASLIELAGWTIGTVCCILGIVSKAEKKDWKLYVSIVGTILGVAFLAFAGVSEDKIKAIITAVIGLVILIASVIPAFVIKKEDKKVEKKL